MSVAYYDAKTDAILEKYGPGPRVHYHVGFADTPKPGTLETLSPHNIRSHIVAAQEAVLRDSADAWNAAETLSGSVLDVGCGLGGGAIFWAERFGARVTALSNVQSHVDMVSSFAADVGVADLVTPMLGDAHDVSHCGPFDAVVAIESSCYLDPRLWFRALSRLVAPGGSIFVIDAFLGQQAIQSEFDRYWRTRISSLGSFVGEAAAAHFELVKSERLNARALGFWDLSLAWLDATSSSQSSSPCRQAKKARSVRAHQRFRTMYADGSLEYARLTFRRGSESAI